MRPHKLSPVKIPFTKLSAGIVPQSAGVYILYRTNMGAPAYIGRDDYRLFEKLDDHRRNGGYHYFKFMPCHDPDDAYEWECLFWHKGQGSIDNAESNGGHHPRPPRGSAVKCPYPGCDYEHHHEEVHETQAVFGQAFDTKNEEEE